MPRTDSERLTDHKVSYRIRHIKCDEEKPACLKCRSTGRTCDGYLGNTKRRTAVKGLVLSAPAIMEQRSSVYVHNLLIKGHLSQAITGTNQQQQCFEYFCLQIGRELSIALELGPTYDFILQACHSDDVVKAAVIAIGSMGQRLRVNHLLTSDNEQANALQEFAQVQYCRSLRHLRARMSSDPDRSKELAIVSCFLFTILEFLQGNEAGSLIHLRSGIKILCRDEDFREATDPLRRELAQIFSIMDRTATIWLGLKSFQSPVFMPCGSLVGLAPAPLSFIEFRSLDDAACALNIQITRLYDFRRSLAAHDPSLRNLPLNAYAQHQEMLKQLEEWPVGVDNHLRSLNGTDFSVEIRQRVSVLQMNYRTTSIMLSSCLDSPEKHGLYHGSDSDFRQILSLARSVIATMDDTFQSRIERDMAANNREVNPAPLFSFYAGVIQPLYILAINCRNLRMCHEALELLSTNPWREGAFDSFSMARIARHKIQQLERDGYYESDRGMDIGTCIDVSTPSDCCELGTPLGHESSNDTSTFYAPGSAHNEEPSGSQWG